MFRYLFLDKYVILTHIPTFFFFFFFFSSENIYVQRFLNIVISSESYRSSTLIHILQAYYFFYNSTSAISVPHIPSSFMAQIHNVMDPATYILLKGTFSFFFLRCLITHTHLRRIRAKLQDRHCTAVNEIRKF